MAKPGDTPGGAATAAAAAVAVAAAAAAAMRRRTNALSNWFHADFCILRVEHIQLLVCIALHFHQL